MQALANNRWLRRVDLRLVSVLKMDVSEERRVEEGRRRRAIARSSDEHRR
jgi:hypothetical protein